MSIIYEVIRLCVYDNCMRSDSYIIRCPANMAHLRQSKPESSLDLVGLLDTAGLLAGTTLTVLPL